MLKGNCRWKNLTTCGRKISSYKPAFKTVSLISDFAKPLRLDTNSIGGGIMLFVRDNIPFRLLKPGNLPSNTEALFIEINLRKKKWLMCCGYNPNKSLINKFTHDIGKVLDSFIGNYDNFLIVGDLNSEIAESSIHDLCKL